MHGMLAKSASLQGGPLLGMVAEEMKGVEPSCCKCVEQTRQTSRLTGSPLSPLIMRACLRIVEHDS